jgi:hypothetical protein
MSPVPPIPAFINTNLFDLFALREVLEATLESGKANIANVYSLNDDGVQAQGATENLFNSFLFLGQYRAEQATYVGDPLSPMIYPVFDRISGIEVRESRQIAGVFVIQFYWRLYLQNVLAMGVDGIIVVLENSFGEAFTYRLDGPEVTYVGPMDLHDTRYNDMEVSANVADFLLNKAGPTTRSYNSVELDGTFDNYIVRIYPSITFEEEYVTNKPATYTAVAALIFAFTSFVFVLYDW